MKTLGQQRWISLAVMAMGLVTLVLGIFLTVGGIMMPGSIMDDVKDEQFPVLTHTGTAQVTMSMDNIISSQGELKDSAEAIRDARWEASMANPYIGAHTLDISGQTTMDVMQGGQKIPVSEINMMLGETVFNLANMGIGLSQIVLFVGIASILSGLCLVLLGFFLNKTSRPSTSVSD
ncbi:MAG: hypothetical protein PHV74_04705 [Dehalococcoidia bacterium]|nr:hypothetical protein [Dehalococcoidia bacterium]